MYNPGALGGPETDAGPELSSDREAAGFPDDTSSQGRRAGFFYPMVTPTGDRIA